MTKYLLVLLLAPLLMAEDCGPDCPDLPTAESMLEWWAYVKLQPVGTCQPSKVIITWLPDAEVQEQCSSTPGVPLTGDAQVWGCRSNVRIWISVEAPCGTLDHELKHWLGWCALGNSDHNHTNPLFEW
jgi:hypothetical protein